MKNITFAAEAFEQFNEWASEDKKVRRKIINLINDILR
jgi:toxin YoeB